VIIRSSLASVMRDVFEVTPQALKSRPTAGSTTWKWSTRWCRTPRPV
jgi:hypothetical protein